MTDRPQSDPQTDNLTTLSEDNFHLPPETAAAGSPRV